LSVRETHTLVQRYQTLVEGPQRQTRPGQQVLPAVAEAQRALSDGLQTRVRVEMGKRRGKIVVDFVSLEELERLLDLMLPAGSSPPARVGPV
jgi:ParB family chromosome partitioning protein